jgi:pimeloyl-ACP methyl ester carboxylesterase
LTNLRKALLILTLACASCTSDQLPTRAATTTTVAPCTSTQAGVCRSVLTLTADAKIAYYRTYPLSTYNAQVTRAVIVVHGTDRNARVAFSDMLGAAQATGNTATTLIIAPRFPINTDTPPPGYLYWDRGADGIDHGWKSGDNAISTNHTSSFTVIDRILRTLNLTTRFPNLHSITLVGHSGGGQVAQKYALGGRQPSLMRPGVTVRYVAANPGSYTYTRPERPNLADSTYQPFTIPATTCPPYDRYKYGMEALNAYMAGTPVATLITQYLARPVTLLLGDQDTSRTGTFDATCQADLQGRNRYERGNAFHAFLNSYYPGHHHIRVVVGGVAHNQALMYNSAQGRAAIFP